MATAGWVAMEWGPVGAKALAETCDVIVVVDVLSFSTSLTIAVEQGAKVWPHTGGESAGRLARDIDAVLAGTRSAHEGLTLSPASLRRLPPDSRIVLPSPDGSLRPAYEDFVGAGAIVDRLQGLGPGVSLTPEAEAAAWAFRALRPLAACPSGTELVDRGFAEDVRIAEEVDASAVVPALVEGRFVSA